MSIGKISASDESNFKQEFKSIGNFLLDLDVFVLKRVIILKNLWFGEEDFVVKSNRNKESATLLCVPFIYIILGVYYSTKKR